MQITRQADYAMRAILHLAQERYNEPVATSQIAKQQNIPFSFLVKIISQLSIVGLIHTSRGAHGGLMLARDPKNITLFDVVQAIDGAIQLNVCVDEKGDCSLKSDCPMRSVWCEAQFELVAKLKNTNFAQLTAQMSKGVC